MTAVATVAEPVFLIGRCPWCKRPFRVEIPADVANRFGGKNLTGCIGYVLPAAGIDTASLACDCRRLPCPVKEGNLHACGFVGCEGHPPTAAVFKTSSVVKATYKAEETCGGSCWAAKSSNCTCSCAGKNHGASHAVTSGRY